MELCRMMNTHGSSAACETGRMEEELTKAIRKNKVEHGKAKNNPDCNGLAQSTHQKQAVKHGAMADPSGQGKS